MVMDVDRVLHNVDCRAPLEVAHKLWIVKRAAYVTWMSLNQPVVLQYYVCCLYSPPVLASLQAVRPADA